MTSLDDPAAIALLDRVETLLTATSPDSWWEGPTFRSPCGTKHCVLSHIADQLGMDAMDAFENYWSTSYVIGAAVDDQPSDRYPQAHPKDRVLAYIANLRTGIELDTWTSIDNAINTEEGQA